MFCHLASVLSFIASATSATSDTTSLLATENGVYTGSQTPNTLPWNTYNYCNAPHVVKSHYSKPPQLSEDGELAYVLMMMRHHKRTPDNLIPHENTFNPSSGWDCSNFLGSVYGNPSETAQVFQKTLNPSGHPFMREIWNGTCDSGQLTKEGLDDAVQHGKDFHSVYGSYIGKVDQQNIYLRTSTESRTTQVAGGFLFGMDADTQHVRWGAATQPANIDSIVPAYSCPAADRIRAASQSIPAWTDHIVQNQPLQTRLDGIFGTAGLSAWDFWYDHSFDVLTSRTCHGHPLPCNISTGQCVREEDAASVFRIGDFEYNYIWNSAVGASNYTGLTYGVMFQELVDNLISFASSPSSSPKLSLFVGHDGSMIRLASGLGFGRLNGTASNSTPLRWPALGSEIIFEVWNTDTNNTPGGMMVRLMWEGTPVPGMEWVKFEDVVDLLKGNIPAGNLFDLCNS